jgi:hypothetical protein
MRCYFSSEVKFNLSTERDSQTKTQKASVARRHPIVADYVLIAGYLLIGCLCCPVDDEVHFGKG